jgi:hypothetical protein
LVEGVPPQSDKGSMEYYEIDTNQYGRYMEFSDKVDFKVVDPIIAHYTKEYSIVAIETLDLLARETLFALANKFYAGMVAGFAGLTKDSKPTIFDLRKITLGMKKQLVKPRSNGRYHVIAGPDFYFDMVTDPTVDNFMRINQNTYSMFSNTKLVPMFDLEFYETLACPAHGEFMTSKAQVKVYGKNGNQVDAPQGDVDNMTIVKALRVYAPDPSDGTKYVYGTIAEDTKVGSTAIFSVVSGYVKDKRTGEDASYIPNQRVWNLDLLNADTTEAQTARTAIFGKAVAAGTVAEFKVMRVLVLGKDCLIRTGMEGKDSAKVYTKAKGSAGVLDPIDQRQSIGFKIDDIGFGSARLEAIVEYDCVPSTLNAI